MSVSVKYIGGDFASKANDLFLKSDHHGIQHFFPEKMEEKKRVFFETGVDALAAILRQVLIVGKKRVCLYFPEHYCMESLERVKLKIDSTQIMYSELSSLLSIEYPASSQGVILLNHFNCFNFSFADLIEKLKLKNWIVIEDFVHAPFEMAQGQGDYLFNSLRKISPLHISIAYIQQSDEMNESAPERGSEYYQLAKKAALLKSEFLETQNKALEVQYLQLFHEAEASLNNQQIFFSSQGEVDLFQQVDWEKILLKRKNNHAELLLHLKSFQDIEVLAGNYMFFMIKSKQRNELRAYLRTHGVFAPIHWMDSRSSIKETILSLPVDQRYDLDDMKRVASLIKEYK